MTNVCSGKEVKTATGVPLLCMTNLVWHVMKQWRPSWNIGEFGLQATEGAWITSRQIEAARIAINRRMNRGADLSPDQWRIVILMGLVLTSVMLYHKQLRHYVLLPSCLALIAGIMLMIMNLNQG